MKAEYVDHMGSDLSVVNAARVSFAKHKDVMDEGDEGLIRFLAKHNHWTPFAHTAITLRMGAPVPIRTQCFKHKAGFVENEESRRYIKSEPVLYVPKSWRKKPEGSVKQGSGEDFDADTQASLTRVYKHLCGEAIRTYLLWTEKRGVCPEQARFLLPQGVEVNWIWTGSLAAYARFYRQRTDPHAQKEIQELAEEVGKIIAPLFPVAWKALTT